MRILVTSSRFPHALSEIRRLGEAGHEVFAADTFADAPGNQSRFVTEAFVTTSPTFDTERYVDQIREVARSRQIDVILPAFEEALYLAPRRAKFEGICDLFAPDADTLCKLHHKGHFVELSKTLGMPVPESYVVRSKEELRDAIAKLPEYIAKPVFSRGGVELLTNVGPLADRMTIEACEPSPTCAWLVQEFVRGEELCSFSVARKGRMRAHCTYIHPKTIENAGGILFESVDDPEALDLARRYIEALDYHGQISFDFIRTERGLVLIECNPRPTAGVSMMSSEDLCAALFIDEETLRVVRPGVRRQFAPAILRDMLRNPTEVWRDLQLLTSGIPDVYAEGGDWMPALCSVFSYSQVLSYRKRACRERAAATDLIAAQFFDVLWDGSRFELAPEREPAMEDRPSSDNTRLRWAAVGALMACLGAWQLLPSPSIRAQATEPSAQVSTASAPSASHALSGSYVLAISRAEAQAILDREIQRAVEEMPMLIKSIAASRLRNGTRIPDHITIVANAERIGVTMEGRTFTTTPGRVERDRSSTGEDMRVTQRYRDDNIEQVFQTESGTRWNTLVPSAQGLRMDGVIGSPRLPTPVRFSLPYRRTSSN